MIKLDYAAMAASAVAIKAMAQTSVTITDPLAQSMGNAAEKEREKEREKALNLPIFGDFRQNVGKTIL